MVKITKRLQAPRSLKNENDYRTNPNWNALVQDCFNKCYICECGKATTLNVEHLIPHKGNDALKYDWGNLFLACGHCNKAKQDRYDNILDPSQIDPEHCIELSLITESFIEKVNVKALACDAQTQQTTNLLNRVYNGNTDIEKTESANLRNEISKCMQMFYQCLKDYQDEPDLGYDVLISEAIARSSEFAAFKRKIIRDDAELSAVFATALQ
ncbi:MAG: HNH endonuclease [Deferribacteraceae bacterium]|jgi:hypothetical protein|nr:HNH endonuclease [Deferribacteraceae bacterium]